LVFLGTANANKAIALLNALLAFRVTPSGAGSASVADNEMTLDLGDFYSGTKARLDSLEQNLSQVQSDITTLYAALHGATIMCNANGTITITFPGIQ